VLITSRTTASHDVGVSRRVYRNAVAHAHRCPEVNRVNKPGTRGIESRNERVRSSVESVTRHISVTPGVHGNCVSLVVVAAAQIGGVNKRARWTEFRHIGVGMANAAASGAATAGSLQGSCRRREVGSL